MCTGLTGEADLPGTLFLQVPDRLDLVIGEMCLTRGLTDAEKRDLACRVLPARVRGSHAERLAWVMPSRHADQDPRIERVLVMLAEPNYRETLWAYVIRGGGPPRLGAWTTSHRPVRGPLVDSLCRALLAPRPAGLRRPRKRRGPLRRPTLLARGRKLERARPRRRPLGRPPTAGCPDCGTGIGEPHERGCDVERCSVCQGQRLACNCAGHDPLAVVWEGEWPDAAACCALGWWAVRTPVGWRPCPPGTPGASVDLNRLAFYRATGIDALYDDVDERMTSQ
jgi:hypothetical protein